MKLLILTLVSLAIASCIPLEPTHVSLTTECAVIYNGVTSIVSCNWDE